MKKILSVLAFLMIAMTSWATSVTEEQPTSGDGTTASPYEIATAGNLVWFANQVNNGSTTICGKLTADVDLGDDQTMIGTEDHMYNGIFDGGDHTITINYTAASDYTALFRYIYNAVIKNLNVAGTLTASGYNFCAGIVSESDGTSTIKGCQCSVDITTADDDAVLYRGGIVGISSGTLTLSQSIYNGKLHIGTCWFFGGLIGITADVVHMFGCWFKPTEMSIVSSLGSATLVYTYGNTYTLEISDCYYSSSTGDDIQGTEATTERLASGEVCYHINGGVTDGTQKWYQNVDNGETADAEPVADNTHGIVYGGGEACPLSTSYSNTTHTIGSYTDDGYGVCSVCNSTCDTYYQPCTFDESSNSYLISNMGNFLWFRQQVNEGNTAINARLATDINLDDDKTMIGTAQSMYSGTFDGDGHTVTVNYTAKDDNTALFRFVNGATIKNLITTGEITAGTRYAGGVTYANQYAAGIVAHCEGETHISCCQSSVAISATGMQSTSGTEGTHGGIVGNNAGTVYITNVLFNGSITGDHIINCGGLVGWSETGAVITNCLFMPTEATLMSTDGSCTMSRGNGVTVTNSYYTTTLGTVQGTETTSDAITNGSLAASLDIDNWIHSYNETLLVPFRSLWLSKDLKLTPAADGTVQLNQTGTVTATLQYVSEGESVWTDITYGTPISLSSGKSIWICAKGTDGKNATLNKESNYVTFSSTCNIAASQNIMSLLDATCTQTTVPEYAFMHLFYDCTYLTTAPALPATTLSTYCYSSMFSGCTSLTEAPALPATTLSTFCYYCMFQNCTGLVSAPALPATTLSEGCYMGMFNNCTAMTAGPVIAATQLDQTFCMNMMFTGCSNLNSVSVNFTDWNTDYSHTYNWMSGVSKTGFFICPASLDASTRNDSRVPDGWTVINNPYTRSMTNKWGTIVMPFDITIDDDDPYDFYQLTAVSGSTLTLTKMTGPLSAGTPAIIRMSESAKSAETGNYELSLAVGDITSATISNPDAVGGLTLTGAYTTTDITDKDGYIIANNSFWNIADTKGENKVYCSPFRAWLAGSISSGAKQLTIGFGEDMVFTAVDALESITSCTAEYYDINGRKLRDLQQGVNLVKFKNGTTKKVIIK